MRYTAPTIIKALLTAMAFIAAVTLLMALRKSILAVSVPLNLPGDVKNPCSGARCEVCNFAVAGTAHYCCYYLYNAHVI